MSFDINTNITSLQAQQYLRTNTNFQTHTINEVTSGLRIVTPTCPGRTSNNVKGPMGVGSSQPSAP